MEDKPQKGARPGVKLFDLISTEGLMTIEPDLYLSYLATRYHVLEPDIIISANRRNNDLDAWLADSGVDRWAFISACNPWSERLDDSQNQRRHQALIKACRPYQIFPAQGEPEQPSDWPAETSLLIVDIGRDHAISLCCEFDQMAILCGERGQLAELIFNPNRHPAEDAKADTDPDD